MLQQLIAGIKELMEEMARRVAPEERAAKRVRPASVAISSDGGEGSQVRPTAPLVAEASAALGILVGVRLAELAEARSTRRAIASVEASEEAEPEKSPSQGSVAPSSPHRASARIPVKTHRLPLARPGIPGPTTTANYPERVP